MTTGNNTTGLETLRGELRAIKFSGNDFWSIAEIVTASGVAIAKMTCSDDSTTTERGQPGAP